MTERRILITGASIAGPAVAFWMRRLGWHVVLLERAPAFREGGQNIDVRGPGRDVLARMGLLEAVQAKNTTEQAWTFVDADNNTVARFDKDDFGGEGPTAELEILRGDLARILDDAAEGVEHRFGGGIVSLEDVGARVDVTFDHGGTEWFDLVVAAEGVGSSSRTLLWGDSVVADLHFRTVAVDGLRGHGHVRVRAGALQRGRGATHSRGGRGHADSMFRG